MPASSPSLAASARWILAVLLFGLCLARAQPAITVPLYPHKDGEADAFSHSGNQKDLEVDGGASPVVAWLTYQLQGIDLSDVDSAFLTLNVQRLASPGTLKAYALAAALDKPENGVSFNDIAYDPGRPLASAHLASDAVERVIVLDVTAAVKSAPFLGIALASEDGLKADFGSKESAMKPFIMLTYKGLRGPAGADGAPGPQGREGAPGLAGPKGDPGAKGDQGGAGASPVTYSHTVLALADAGSAALNLATNRAAFAAGQRLRIASAASPSRFMEGTLNAYDTATGAATVALDYARGAGVDSDWTVVTAGVPGATAWKDTVGTVKTLAPVGIGGNAGTDPLTVSGAMKLSGYPGALKFADNSSQTTAYVPSAHPTIDAFTALADALAKANDSLGKANDRVTALEKQLAAVQSQMDAWKGFLAYFSKTGDTVRVTGANLQIVNGTENTMTANGLGNLIVGYNETSPLGSIKTGSHNVVVGYGNAYSSYGGMVGGMYNQITGPFATVTGGLGNAASGNYSSVSGGFYNAATGTGSSVSGGWKNTSDATTSSVSGGHMNHATSDFASVSGGAQNTASGTAASISGGELNQASGSSSSVGGGAYNSALGGYAAVGGGWADTASGSGSFASGGSHNKAANEYSSISGGTLNIADGKNASVSGGESNHAFGASSSVSGGGNNFASGAYAIVSGGWGNTSGGTAASVSAGLSNSATSSYASVSGGSQNTADGAMSSVSGGNINHASGPYSSVSGGLANSASGNGASVSGGELGSASGISSSISGGFLNSATGTRASVAGGQSRTQSINVNTTVGSQNFGP